VESGSGSLILMMSLIALAVLLGVGVIIRMNQNADEGIIYTVDNGYIEHAWDILGGSIYPLFDISVSTDISNILATGSIYPLFSL